MKKSHTTISIIILLCITMWVGMKIQEGLTEIDELGKPHYNKEQIYFPKKNTSLYLKSKNWGLTADHKVSVISTSSELEFEPDSISEYIFQGFGGLVFKTVSDTLKVYTTQKPNIPQGFKSDVIVEFIELKDNREWIKLNEKIKNGYRKFE